MNVRNFKHINKLEPYLKKSINTNQQHVAETLKNPFVYRPKQSHSILILSIS